MAIPELESRLLEVVDWVQAVDELQAWADDETHDRAARSQAWSRVAGASADLLLDEARALDASQRAFKLDQRNLGALSQARRLYRRRGHIAMAIKLGGLELRLEHDPRRQASLRVELGRALLDQGSLDQTVSILTLVAEAGETIEAGEAARGLLDQVRAAHEGGERALSTLQDELGSLADLEGAGSSVSRRLMGAAWSLQARDPDDPRLLPLLEAALAADPTNDDASRLCEARLAAAGRLDALRELQERCARLAKDPAEEIRLRRGFAVTWRSRYDDPEIMAHHLRRAVELAYTTGALGEPWWHVAAYRALARRPEARADPDVLVALARRGLAIIQEPDEAAGLALLAATLADEAIGDPETTRSLLEPAVTLAPGHPLVRRPWPQAEP